MRTRRKTDGGHGVAAIALLACSAFHAIFSQADTETVDGVTYAYSVANGEVSIGTGQSWGSPAIDGSTAGTLVLPSTLGGYPVTEIGGGAFFGCGSLTNVVMPGTVSNIADCAFQECGLTALTIPDGVTNIGYHAFSGCFGLPKVVVPGKVISMGILAFGGCENLVEATVYGCPRQTAQKVFGNCHKLRTVRISGSMGTIPWIMFSDCSALTSVTLYEGIKVISDGAFEYCTSLETITMPVSLKTLDGAPFNNCTKLKNVVFNGNAPSAQNPYWSSSAAITNRVFIGTTGWSGTAGDPTIPDTWKGFPIEVYARAPEPVPVAWLDGYDLPGGTSAADYDAAATNIFANGVPAWQSYVVGLDPTNAASAFTARIVVSNGVPCLAWTPDLGAARTYTVEGRATLDAGGSWAATNAASRFFRVRVQMP